MNNEQIALLRKFIYMLEHSDYTELCDYIDKLSEKDVNFIGICVYGNEALAALVNHKIALADLLTKTTGVSALAEDRTRIVFLLAKYVGSTLKAVDYAFQSEFGLDFRIFESYVVKEKKYSWHDLATKAVGIRNGYRNYELLNARPVVQDIMSFYRLFDVQDKKVLEQCLSLANQILPKTAADPMAIPGNKNLDATLELIKTLFKITGHLDIEFEELGDRGDFDEINEQIFRIKFVTMARLELISKKIPLDDTKSVEHELLKLFAQRFSLSYRGDELARKNVRLKKENVAEFIG